MKLYSSKAVWGLVAAVALTTQGTKSLQADVQIYQQTLPGTTWILAETREGLSRGSGVLVDRERRLILTNAHVVGDATRVMVFFPQMKAGQIVREKSYYMQNRNKLSITGKVLSTDKNRDLALVQLESVPESAPEVQLAPRDVGTAEELHSIGNPGTSGALWVYSKGWVRAVYKTRFRTELGVHDVVVLESQSPINRGDSGGPVVNTRGELVGITQSFRSDARLMTHFVSWIEIRNYLNEEIAKIKQDVAGQVRSLGMTFQKTTSGPLAVSVKANADPIYVGLQTENYGQLATRKVWSLAVTVNEADSAKIAVQLLQQNAQTKLGGWVLEADAKGNLLVMFVAKIDAGASEESLKTTLEYIAEVTDLLRDSVEKQEVTLIKTEQPKIAQSSLQTIFGSK